MLFTYFAVTSILIVVQVGLLAAYLLFLKEKSRASLYLGLSFLNLVFFQGAYIFAYTVVDPIGAYHRILTVLLVLPSLGYFSMFMHSFSEIHFKKEYAIAKYAIPGLSILNLLYFLHEIQGQKPYFVFSGHFYNYNAGFVTSIMILLFLVYFIIVAARKMKVVNKKDLKAVKKIFWAVLFVVLAPGITNSLNLKGIIEREIHQTTFTVTNVVGYFTIAVIYINHTIDRSTFMVKIVGVSVLLLLVMFLSIAMFIIPRQDKYIAVLQKNHALTAVNSKEIHDSVQYIASRGAKKAFHILYERKNVHMNPESLAEGGISCMIFDSSNNPEKKIPKDKIRHLTGADHPDKLGRIWRCDSKTPGHFYLAYHIYGTDGRVYEVGFQYSEYRVAINEVSEYLAYLALLIIIGTVLGLPFFFKVSLVQPLDKLLQGLKEVHEGNLDVQLEVQIQDEIGYLTESFNTMVSSIRVAQDKLKEYAEGLEEKVKERTKELENSLKEVEALKKQQDGDYYLTQLLIAPLGKNAASASNTKVEFFVKQKKSFKFRKWEAELGGDLCMSHDIHLSGKNYVLFVNGDAMGKSMQGAGGALVLGAVFQSIVERTKLSNEIKSRSPERWLKNVYQELQKVFETFDGSMLVSVIIGLVETESGLMYWFNAEHPWLILYRDGVCEFLEDDLHLRKLGTKGLPSFFTVKTFLLQEGDIVFGGSDGKDDTAVYDEETGDRVINEDESRILEVVQKTGADLHAIYEELQKDAELTDDISMLKIQYHPQESSGEKMTPEAAAALKKLRILVKENIFEDAYILVSKTLQEGIFHSQLLKEAVKVSLKLKRYEEAAQYAGQYVDMHPENEEFIFIASYAAKMSGHLNLAADYGERLALRNIYHIKNLINLADVYLSMKVFSRAKELIEKAKEVEPENEKIRKLEAAIPSF